MTNYFKINLLTERKPVHDNSEIFYRIWFCVIISQITFSGIIVELIWSYNQTNFFFWLQVYSWYSIYTCLSAILHNKYEKYIPIAIIIISIFLSRFLDIVVMSLWKGLSLFDFLQQLTSKLENEIDSDNWINPINPWS